MTVVVGVLVGVVVFGAQSAPTALALANVGTVSARISDHTEADGSTAGDCIRYSPYTSGTTTDWSTGPVVTGHGVRTGNCRSIANGDTATIEDRQSALEFTPVTPTAPIDVTPTLLGQLKHFNWPVTIAGEHFAGVLSLQLSGMTVPGTGGAPAVVDFPWTWWETPNQSTGCTTGYENDGCDDQLLFPSSVSQQIVVQTTDPTGTQYRLVVNGFVRTTTTCPTTEAPNATVDSSFLTVEGQVTAACLYMSVQPIRQLTIVKATAGTTGTLADKDFGFSSTSVTTGSAWDNKSFSLNPSATATSSRTAEILSQDTVVVAENALTPDNWSLDSATCTVNGAAFTTGVSFNSATQKLTLDHVGEGGPISCTFTNRYTPKATLTLVKQVVGGTAAPTAWTLNATGSGTAAGAAISGATASSAVTTQRVPAGDYTLSEVGGPNGYAASAWTCTNSVSVMGATISLVDGARTVCTITNRFATGALKIVSDPAGGYTGGTTQAFTGTYDCGGGFAGSFVGLTTAAPVIVTPIPAGSSCTVSEVVPTVGLANGSYVWGSPTYTADVVISDGTTSIITITNPVVQHVGRFSVSKVVTAGPGATAGGFTGGSSRAFPVGYSCSLGTYASSGTLNPTIATTATSPLIPSGASCALSESVASAAGDFADPSYAWSTNSFSPVSPITIGIDTTVAVTVTNTYMRNFGSIDVSKTVAGAGYIGTGEPFTVTYDCGTGFSGTVALASDGTKSITGLPVGSICTFGETTPDDRLLAPAYDWATPTWKGLGTGNQVTVTSTPKSVGVTNPTVAVFGQVSVTKALTGATAGVVATATFALAVDCGAVYSGTFTVAVGVTRTTPNLPVGTSCTISETLPTAGLVDSSYGWGPTPAAQTVTLTAAAQVIAVTVTNTVVRVVAPLTVAKVLDAPAGVVAATRTYAITWSCQYGTDAPITGSVDLQAGASSVVSTKILLGSTCTVTEPSTSITAPPSPTDSSYVWQGPSYAPNQTVDIATGAGATVTVTNAVRQLTGSFSIAKIVVGPSDTGLAPNTRFGFSWSCALPDGTTQTSGGFSVMLLNGGSANAPTLPAGSVCTVTEAAFPATTGASFTWDGLTFAVTGATGSANVAGRSVTFSIPAPVDGSPATVQATATNTLSQKFGVIDVAKVVSGQTGGFVGASTQDFAVTLACGSAGTQTVMVKSGATAPSTSLPIGTVCDVTEVPPAIGSGLQDASYGWDTPIIDHASVSVGTSTVTVTVTNPIMRLLGTVQVTKTVSGPSGVVPAGRMYTGGWTCKYRGATVGGGTWSTTAGAAPLVLSTTLPRTSTCVVSEDALAAPAPDPSYRWLAPVLTGATVTATAATLTVENTLVRDTGSITVTKHVTGATAGYTGGTVENFTAHYSCTTPTVSGALQGQAAIADGIAKTLAVGIPFGWTCAISETSPTGNLVDASYAWGDPIIATPSVTLGSSSAAVDVTIENPIVRVTGPLQIVKTVVGVPGLDLAAVVTDRSAVVYSGAYSCQYGSDPAITGTWATDFDGATVVAPGAFLLGSVCTVTEKSPTQSSLANTTFAWNAPVVGDAVTVVSAGVPATLTVQNSVKRVWGSLAITKVVTGATGGVAPGKTVSGNWSCALGAETSNGSWTLAASGGSVNAFVAADAKVPVGSTCTITETTPSNSDLVDASFNYTSPVLSTPVVLAVDATPALKVTNNIRRVYGDLRITKHVSGAVADDGLVETGQLFSGTYSCVHPGDADEIGAWSTTPGAVTTIPAVLVGSVCTVTENTPGGPPVVSDSSYSWTTPVIPSPVTIANPAQPAVEVTVDNPTVRITGVPPASADLAIVKTSSVPNPAANTSFDWVLTVTNDGPQAALGVVVTDDVPNRVTVTAVTSSTFVCSFIGNAVRCDKASMANGETGTVVITVAVPADLPGQTIENIGTVTATTPDADQSDNSSANTVLTRVVDVLAPLPPAVPMPAPPLPVTGTDSALLLELAGLLCVAGFALRGVRRRRVRSQ